MYASDVRNLDLKAAKSQRIPGYRRYVMYSDREYGLDVGDFNSKVKFGFVMYKLGPYNTGKIKVELKVLVPSNVEGTTWRLSDIDPNFIKKLLEPIEEWGLRQAFTIENGVGYFNGYAQDTYCPSISYCLLRSKLAVFLNTYGDALATVLLGKGNVKTLKDALEVNDLLISVDAFSKEMQAKSTWGTATYNKECAQKKHDELKTSLTKLEEEMNYIYGLAQEDKDVLANYGIKEYDIEFS